MDELKFPSLYEVSDSASIEAQRKYLSWLKFQLILLVVAAVVAIPEIEMFVSKRCINIMTACLFLSTIGVSLYLYHERFEKVWYGSRAVAESVKSLSWKYMMASEPFDYNNQKSEELFLSRIADIFRSKKDLAINYTYNPNDQFPPGMRAVRTLNLSERKEIYLEKRVVEQKKWYINKGNTNSKLGKRYFYLFVFLQILSVFYSFFLILFPMSPNLFGAITTIAACVFSWTQLKKFQELAQAYTVTGHELSFVESVIISSSDEKSFQISVSDAESAISREHTMWIARRDG